MNTVLTDRDLLQQARDALDTALTGLRWYRDTHPESVDGSDGEADKEINAAIAALDAALSLPAAQLAETERGAFEKWSHDSGNGGDLRYYASRNEYMNLMTQGAWTSWLARAMLAAPAAQPAETDERLHRHNRIAQRIAIWKSGTYINLDEFMDDVRALLAAPAAQPGWQDIASAPKNGTSVLMYHSGRRAAFYQRDKHPRWWVDYFREGTWWHTAPSAQPTHWKPLDQPVSQQPKELK